VPLSYHSAYESFVPVPTVLPISTWAAVEAKLYQVSKVSEPAMRSEGESGTSTKWLTPLNASEGLDVVMAVGKVVLSTMAGVFSVTSALSTYRAWLPAVAAVLAETAP